MVIAHGECKYKMFTSPVTVYYFIAQFIKFSFLLIIVVHKLQSLYVMLLCDGYMHSIHYLWHMHVFYKI